MHYYSDKSLIKGQGYNLVEVLRRSELGDSSTGSPAALLLRPPVAVFEEEDSTTGFITASKRRFRRIKQNFQSYANSRPWFTFC